MKWTQLRSFLFCFCLVAAQVGVVKADAGFHRDQCYEEVRNILQGNGTSTITHPSMFFSTSDATNPILTLSGCNQLCGSGTGWYPDRIPRLVAWLLPIFLLLSNMQFAPIGLEKFLLILRLLGDPIDSTWSLLAKVDRWGQHHSHAQKLLQDKIEIKSLTMVLAATDEDPHAIDHAFAFDSSANKALILEAAITLRENRKNEVRRTFFAIVLYVFSVLAAFVPAVGAASNPSGGRIGTAMLLSWLLTVVLLSNTVGDFGSPRNRQKILADLMERLGQEKKEETLYKAPGAWSGAIYCYNPRKRFLHGSGWKLALISVPPVAIASGTAFVTLFTGPSHFSCRDVFVVIVFSAWMISAISTSFLSWASFATGKYLWYIVLIKDTVIAIPILALIIASSCGLWNTCSCWSGAMLYGRERARAPLNPTKVFDENNHVIYPAVVATCLSLQICVFGAMLWVVWPGFKALWWTEREKRVASNMGRRIHHSTTPTPTNEIKLQCLKISSNEVIDSTP